MIRVALKVFFAAAVLFSLVVGGFALRHFELGPFTGLVNKAENKFDELRGLPTEIESRFDVIETTTVRLRGEVYEIERPEWATGGALAVWGDDLLVMDRLGVIRRFVDGEGVVETDIVAPDNGLADYEAAAESEEYATYQHNPESMRYNGLTYVDAGPLHGLAISYTHYEASEGCYDSRVSWLEIPRDTGSAATLRAAAEDWQEIFRAEPCIPLNPIWAAIDGYVAGGRMAFQAPSTLFVSVGEYFLDGIQNYDIGIQSPDSDYGKVIAIDLATAESDQFAIGFRNPQGITLDTEGRLWVTDHGLRGGDELNLVVEGANYGWPLETLGTLYSGLPFPGQGEPGRHDIHTAPVYAWLPSAAISSLTALDGFDPTWDGDLLAGSLAFPTRGQSLFHIRVDGDRVQFVEQIRLDRRVRDVKQFGDRIAVLLDRNLLALFHAEERQDVLARALELAAADGMAPDTHQQVSQVMQTCAQCHNYGRDMSANGPVLAGVIGRRIGGSSFPNYSETMANFGGVWTRENLTAFLTDTEGFMPGTSMPAANVPSGPVVEGVLDVLEIVEEEAGYVAGDVARD